MCMTITPDKEVIKTELRKQRQMLIETKIKIEKDIEQINTHLKYLEGKEND